MLLCFHEGGLELEGAKIVGFPVVGFWVAGFWEGGETDACGVLDDRERDPEPIMTTRI